MKAYPVDELEWLVVFAFNLATDCYQDSRDSECKDLVERVLKLVQLIDDTSLGEELLQRVEALRRAM